MNSVFIIAEAGVNHNGDIELAKKLIDQAKEAGADAIKFQTFKAESLVTKYADKAGYQIETTGNDESQYAMIKKLELSYSCFKELKKYCEKKEILFLSSPFDLESIDFLQSLDMKIFKIPSGEITNFPYLKKVAQTGKEVILSTGMANMKEIEQAIEVLLDNGLEREGITILHCSTQYPTPMEDVNLLAMNTIKQNFDVKIGYSDHTAGITIPIAAVALGAQVIEKHFTFDKTATGPDHRASLDQDELISMIKAIRDTEIAFGSSEKMPTSQELENKKIARKSIVAAVDITKGEKLSEKNLTVKRPGNGVSPMLWKNFIGKEASQDFKKDELIK